MERHTGHPITYLYAVIKDGTLWKYGLSWGPRGKSYEHEHREIIQSRHGIRPEDKPYEIRYAVVEGWFENYCKQFEGHSPTLDYRPQCHFKIISEKSITVEAQK